MTSTPMSGHRPLRTETAEAGHPTKLIVLSTILYAIFAFVVTIVALNVFWPAGLILGLVLGWRGGFIPSFGPRRDADVAFAAVAPAMTTFRPSGNASFDAYRADMLARLEQEQSRFDGFLERLRAARDKSEFDQFMDDRARKVAGPADDDVFDGTPALREPRESAAALAR